MAVFIDLYRKTRALAVVNHELQREIAARQAAQETLQQVNQELEGRVAERTAALTVAHLGVKENEERLRMAMEVAEIAAWEWDTASGRMTWSAEPESPLRVSRWVVRRRPARVRQGASRRPAARPGCRRHRDRTLARPTRASTASCAPTASTSGSWSADARCTTSRAGYEKIVGVSRDISAQRRAEQARELSLISERRARDEAERQSRFKDEFLATLSHELRTPMNAILGWLSMLAKGDVVRDPEQAMAVIQRNAQVQSKLIEDLLEVNKLTSGTVRLEIGPLDIGAAVDAAIESLKPTADTKGVHLSVQRDDVLPRISADGRRVQQILLNLLHNAVKFTRAGGSVAVLVDCVEGSVRIQVKDTGQGIAAEFLPHVFDRFRQADPSTTRGAWGLGLGLSITKHLVELHGGSIEAASEGLDQGATFIVRLPVRQISAPDDCSSGAGDVSLPSVPEMAGRSEAI